MCQGLFWDMVQIILCMGGIPNDLYCEASIPRLLGHVTHYMLLLWPSTTKWGSLRRILNWEKYFIEINKHYFLHVLMQKLFRCDIPIKSCEMLNIPIYDIIQNIVTEIWVVKDCNLCVLLCSNQEANVPITPLSSHIFISKKYCAWMMNI